VAGESQILQRYARALHELAAQAGAVERVGADMHAVMARLGGSAESRRQLASPRLAREKKRALLVSLLPPGSHDLVRRTLLLMIDKGRGDALAGFGAAWDEVAMAAAGRALAQVTSAAPLDDLTRARLVAQLSRLTGKTIGLQESVDPALLGGSRILVGSRMLDGSVAARLSALRKRLMAAPLPATPD
jgi:F-type H+-transporting ATPase subunit delta